MSNSSSKGFRIVVPPVCATEQVCDVVYDNGVTRRYSVGRLPLCLRDRIQRGCCVWYDGDYMIIDLV